LFGVSISTIQKHDYKTTSTENSSSSHNYGSSTNQEIPSLLENIFSVSFVGDYDVQKNPPNHLSLACGARLEGRPHAEA